MRQLLLREGIRNIQECLETPKGFVGSAAKLHTAPNQPNSYKRQEARIPAAQATSLLPHSRCKGRDSHLALSPACLPTHGYSFAALQVE